jgi:hypothetical protein
MFGIGFTSSQTNKVRATGAPVNTVPPSIPGTAVVDTTITCNIGTWNYGTSQPLFVWYVNDEIVLEGENEQNLFIDSRWSGSVIYCEIAVCNVYGCGRGTSNTCTVE